VKIEEAKSGCVVKKSTSKKNPTIIYLTKALLCLVSDLSISPTFESENFSLKVHDDQFVHQLYFESPTYAYQTIISF